MSDNQSQLGRVPSESSFETNHTDNNIDRILTMEIVTIDPSSLQFVTTTAIVVNSIRQVPNVKVQNIPTTRQLARRRQPQRRRERQRHRYRQQDMIHEQRQRQRRDWIPRSPPRHRHHMDNSREQCIQRLLNDNCWNPMSDRDPRQQPMESPTGEALLDAYNLEKIDPKDTYEQEKLHEFEGFVVLERLQLLNGEIDQQENIDAEERLEQARPKRIRASSA